MSPGCVLIIVLRVFRVRPRVQIPIKYVTYFAVGFNATCVVPYLFNILRI